MLKQKGQCSTREILNKELKATIENQGSWVLTVYWLNKRIKFTVDKMGQIIRHKNSNKRRH